MTRLTETQTRVLNALFLCDLKLFVGSDLRVARNLMKKRLVKYRGLNHFSITDAGIAALKALEAQGGEDG